MSTLFSSTILRASARSRPLVGAGLGLALGLVYGLSSGLINSIVLWGVPLRVNVGGVVVTVLLMGLGTMLAGYVTAWPESSITGMMAGALCLVLAQMIQNLANQTAGVLGFVIAACFLLPTLLLVLPFTGLLRWGVNTYETALHSPGRPRWLRPGGVGLGLIAFALILGSITAMPESERAALRQVNQLIQSGLAAASEADVPPSLAALHDFRARASGRYTLDLRSDESTGLAFSAVAEKMVVDVLFDDGWHFQCVVGRVLALPVCTED